MILASGSPRRREILEDLGISPIVRPADVDETPREGESPTELVERLACAKAEACAADLPAELAGQTVLAADTIVWREGGHALGKPANDDQARAMLEELSGATHHVSTGVCLLVRSGGREERVSFHETTDVRFRTLSAEEIGAYVRSGEPADKAGSYGIQGLGRLLVSGIEGDYYNVVGLPVTRTLCELDRVLERRGGDENITRILEGLR
ncbi:Maf family protein [Olsenella intestinalis]|uniref:Maf family protein n=1 Tax=Olsenella intestinalis TaxID=2930083 RepID=UPI00200DBA7B|nr:Maf family protein [Olsenella intestinalis]